MAYIDYYKILGIDKNASPQDIRKAYRKQAKKYHPDLNKEDPHAQEHFQAINEANEVLSDPEKRKKYDEYGENWKHAEEFEAQRHQYNTKKKNENDIFSGYDFNNTERFSDFFEQLFGNGLGKRYKTANIRRGKDYQSIIELSLQDIMTNHKQIIDINGKKIRITIPAGVMNGQKIRLKGHGEEVSNGINGDLYITFHINDNPVFTRIANDLYTTVSVDIYTMILGGEIIVPTLSGNVRMRINPDCKPDSKLRLRGKGIPMYKKENEFGDLIVNLKIELPTLNEKQKKLLRQIQENK